MAIIIPSKNIYEINDNKVIDNEVDNLEVGAVKPNEIYDYKTIVLDSDYTNLGLYEDDSYDLRADSKYLRQSPATQQEMEYYAEAISYVNIRPAYTTITIKIPKEQAGKLISKIYGKEDIKYSLALQKEIVPTMPKVQISGSNQPTSSNISLLSWSWDYNSKRTEDISAVELKNYLSADNPIEAKTGTVLSVSANAAKTLENGENLLSKDAVLNSNNEWELVDLKFLTAVYVEKASYKEAISKQYSATGFPITPNTNVRTLTGEAEIYGAKQLSVTIYGDTITLDLQDETLKIGDGQHVYSFSGNELMQTTNTDSVKDTYQKVIDDWEPGKETATLRCAIANYKDDNENVVISSNSYKEIWVGFTVISSDLTQATIYCNTELRNGDVITFEEDDLKLIVIAKSNSSHNYYNVKCYNLTAGMVAEGETYKASVNKPITDNLYFKFGDIVEPYVYGVHGKDKPMATYKDGTPKHFKVTGVHIISDGGIYQDIDIKEIRHY